ncbi:MAG: hypothetical protein KGI92_10790 [Alphaproteobacteria bacterium]|nr:hypothetical protein [Alphaproteobacteria bacterium]
MAPQSNSSKPKAHLDEWRIIRVREGAGHLVGRVSGHPRLRDCARIVSSALVAVAGDGSWAETINTIYVLGTRGEGPLPEEWAACVDYFLREAWCTTRVSEH